MIDLINRIIGKWDYPAIEWTNTDKWIAKDKLRHFILHFLIGIRYSLACDTIGGAVFSNAFGFVWEMYDSARGAKASYKDLVANNAGFIVGAVIGTVFH